MNKEAVFRKLDEKKQMVLDAERFLWNNPEPGYKEWKAHAYLKAQYEALGLQPHEFDRIPASVAVQSAADGQDRVFEKIPGFYVDFETGRPGPRVAVFGELDSLVITDHPGCDKETGAVHACGHNCQSAGLLGVAIALSAPGALDGLSGSIRLIAVPAEELIELEFRRKLKEQGVIRYFGGKQELLYRGLLDDCNLAFMIHTGGGRKLTMTPGSDGCIVKEQSFIGKSSHAGGAPHAGVNALYAANAALSVANALRETFLEKDYIRFHPIITAGGSVVNAIPSRVTVESYVRGATVEATVKANEKINRAFAGAAAAMGCGLEIHDMSGYAPRENDETLNELFAQAGRKFLPEEDVVISNRWTTGCSDMGDISCVMPAAHPHIGGAVGHGHGTDYYINDPELACVTSAKVQTELLFLLLENEAAAAKKIVAGHKPPFASVKAFLDEVDRIEFNGEAVSYNEDGSVTLRYKQ